jgi:cob(I)alamin adenosyltransferase
MMNMTDNDRERFGIMESQLKDLRDDVRSIHTKIDDFILSADKKYATKEHLCRVESQFLRRLKERDIWVRWIPSVISVIIAFIAVLLSLN